MQLFCSQILFLVVSCCAAKIKFALVTVRYVDEFWMTNDQLVKFPPSGEHSFTADSSLSNSPVHEILRSSSASKEQSNSSIPRRSTSVLCLQPDGDFKTCILTAVVLRRVFVLKRMNLSRELRMDQSIKNMATQFAGEDAEEIVQMRDLLLAGRQDQFCLLSKSEFCEKPGLPTQTPTCS